MGSKCKFNRECFLCGGSCEGTIGSDYRPLVDCISSGTIGGGLVRRARSTNSCHGVGNLTIGVQEERRQGECALAAMVMVELCFQFVNKFELWSCASFIF